MDLASVFTPLGGKLEIVCSNITIS